jgi:hypothetical protein
MNIELWKLFLSGAVLLVTTVTGPIIVAMRAEAKAIRAEMETLRVELKAELTKTEGRLNDRINTKLVHR